MQVACQRCGRIIDTGTLCDECRSTYRSPTERPYDSAEWRRISRRFLARNKWCASSLHRGKKVPATVADHYPHSRRELLAKGVANPDDEKYLRPLCTKCHNARGASHTMRFTNDPA